jgi:hypothetical protein
MAEERAVSWQVPIFETDPHTRKGWVEELIQNGDRWLKSQRSIQHINDDVKLLMGHDQKNSLESNTLQTDIRTFVETISDLRQIATYGSKAEQFKKHVETYNGVIKHIFWDSHFPQQSRKALQYAMLGRGYLWVKSSRDRFGWGKNKIVFDALGPMEFLPEQLPPDNDVQGCYGGTIIRAMGIAETHARFPRFQDKLQPIARYDWKAYGTLAMARRMDFNDRFRLGEESHDWDNHYCENRYSFIRDLRVNTTGRRLQMGFPGTTWGYEVPSLGELIVSINPFNGLPESRKATEEDCRVYPNLRLIITNPTVPVPMYDGPAFDWHGEIPAVQYDVNDWVWSPLGYSLVHGVAGVERARRALLSSIDTVAKVNLDPPMGYDLHSGVPQEQMKKMDLLRSQGYRIGVNGDPKKALQSVLPEEMKVNNEHFKQLEVLGATIKQQLGLTDITSMREMKLNISTESFDKILENLGPIATGIAGNMSIAHGKIAYMLKFSIPQYFTTAEIMSYVGMNGVSLETFDYDPNSLIPSHLPGEMADHGASKHDKMDRAKWFAQQLSIVAVPTQLLNVTQQLERMMYMLFLQKGAQVSMGTIMEKLGVQNYGSAAGDTEREKWKSEQVEELMFKLKTQMLAQSEMQAAGMQPPPAPPGKGAGPGRGKGGGRPPSGKAPPKQEMRGTTTGNPRVITSQSK